MGSRSAFTAYILSLTGFAKQKLEIGETTVYYPIMVLKRQAGGFDTKVTTSYRITEGGFIDG